MNRTQALLPLLDVSLSDTERRQVLAGALLSLDEEGLETLFSLLAEDTSATLRRILSQLDGDHPAIPHPSVDRLEQEWRQAWSAWEDIIEESNDEEGEFVEQERHWEPPYLEVSAVALQLDEVAARMSAIMDGVLRHQLDPDFDLLEEVDGSIRAIGDDLPEYFGEHVFDWLFGPELTALVLRWQWMSAPQAATGFTVLDEVRQAEADSDRWRLDGSALLAFVRSMPDIHQRELLAGLASCQDESHWEAELTSTWSPWFAAYRELTQRWDPAAELAICRASIASDWSLAIPVLEDILARGALDEAGPVIDEALDALLRLRGQERWSPLDGLLVDHPALRCRHPPAERAPELMRLIARIAEGHGEQQRSAALDSQAFLHEHWYEWDVVLEHLGELRSGPWPKLAGRFFELWTALVVQRASRHRYGEDPGLDRSWIASFANALWAGASSERILSELGRWLDEGASSASAFRAVRPCLAVLTQDIGLGEAAPALLDLLGERCSQDAPSRRSQLQRIGAAALVPKLLATWRRHAALLVPDPRDNHKSRYDTHAAWLAAVRELDAGTCARIVASWKREHGRRRNLWKAVRARGLPV